MQVLNNQLLFQDANGIWFRFHNVPTGQPIKLLIDSMIVPGGEPRGQTVQGYVTITEERPRPMNVGVGNYIVEDDGEPLLSKRELARHRAVVELRKLDDRLKRRGL